MSNLLFNIRFGTHHWQITNDYKMDWVYNPAQAKDRDFEPEWKWFQVYCIFGKHL